MAIGFETGKVRETELLVSCAEAPLARQAPQFARNGCVLMAHLNDSDEPEVQSSRFRSEFAGRRHGDFAIVMRQMYFARYCWQERDCVALF
jgi:hypothetical protein